MGLLAPPDALPELVSFRGAGDAAGLRLLIERALLSSRQLRSGEMLVNVEGWGRFRVRLELRSEEPSTPSATAPGTPV